MKIAPDVRELPAQIRWRLAGLVRVVVRLAMTCLSNQPPTPIVSALLHGSLQRTAALLSDLTRVEPLSQATFSLSVHNSIVRVRLIVRGDRSPITAVAAEAKVLGAAGLDAADQLPKSTRQVLIIYADELAGDPYCDPLDYPRAPFGLALLLRPTTDGQTDMALHWQNAHAAYEALSMRRLAFLNTQPNNTNTPTLGIGHTHRTLEPVAQA